jgi:hypothetical protein
LRTVLAADIEVQQYLFLSGAIAGQNLVSAEQDLDFHWVTEKTSFGEDARLTSGDADVSAPCRSDDRDPSARCPVPA